MFSIDDSSDEPFKFNFGDHVTESAPPKSRFYIQFLTKKLLQAAAGNENDEIDKKDEIWENFKPGSQITRVHYTV